MAQFPTPKPIRGDAVFAVGSCKALLRRTASKPGAWDRGSASDRAGRVSAIAEGDGAAAGVSARALAKKLASIGSDGILCLGTGAFVESLLNVAENGEGAVGAVAVVARAMGNFGAAATAGAGRSCSSTGLSTAGNARGGRLS